MIHDLPIFFEALAMQIAQMESSVLLSSVVRNSSYTILETGLFIFGRFRHRPKSGMLKFSCDRLINAWLRPLVSRIRNSHTYHTIIAYFQSIAFLRTFAAVSEHKRIRKQRIENRVWAQVVNEHIRHKAMVFK